MIVGAAPSADTTISGTVLTGSAVVSSPAYTLIVALPVTGKFPSELTGPISTVRSSPYGMVSFALAGTTT